jgi:collagenase-like PrtC family protease
MPKFELHVNKPGTFRAAAGFSPDSIAVGDDSCAIRCAASWNALNESLIQEVGSRCRNLYLITPQLLAERAEVADFARLVARLVGLGFNGVIFNNIGLLDVVRDEHPGLLDRVRIMAGRRLPTYNSRDLGVLRRMGFTRATLSVELSVDDIRAFQIPAGLELAMMGYGPLSLAYSRMCYTMSMKGETEYEHCGIACEKEGLDLGSTGEDPVFLLYGREILSARRFCAARAMPLLSSKLDVIEIVLQKVDAIAEVARAMQLLAAASAADAPPMAIAEGESELAALVKYGLCNGTLFGRPGVAYVTAC